MLTLTSEHPYYADKFESKLQANISTSDQSIWKQEEESIEFKEEHHDELRKFSS